MPEDGTEDKWIKPQYLSWCTDFRKRVGHTVYVGYMLDEWKVPTPNVEGLAQKFCVKMKHWLDYWIRGHVMSARKGLRDIERILLKAGFILKQEMLKLSKID